VQERLDAQYAEQAASHPVWAGIPADRIPDGVSPATAMLAAAKDAQPRRKSVLEHALDNSGEFSSRFRRCSRDQREVWPGCR
jgi:hypothetical protein